VDRARSTCQGRSNKARISSLFGDIGPASAVRMRHGRVSQGPKVLQVSVCSRRRCWREGWACYFLIAMTTPAPLGVQARPPCLASRKLVLAHSPRHIRGSLPGSRHIRMSIHYGHFHWPMQQLYREQRCRTHQGMCAQPVRIHMGASQV